MNPETHERARRLIDAVQVEGIAALEREWLEAHLAECAACQIRARANERALQALRQSTVRVDPALVSTTQARVRLRARELRENQMRMRTLWITCGLSWLLGAIGAAALAGHGLVGAPLRAFTRHLDYRVRSLLGCSGHCGWSAGRVETRAGCRIEK